MADFYKYHGLGNDYLIIDPNKISFPLSLSKENIQLISHRNYGIGGDGILYGPIMDEDKITFKIFNPDGYEAEKSGNGIRIFALYALDQGYTREKCFDLYVKSGKVTVELIDSRNSLIKVDMGEYSFTANKIPTTLCDGEVLNKELEILGGTEIVNCVNLGNPHCVLFKEKITEKLVRELGSVIEVHHAFPNRINIQIVKVLDSANIKIEIWERGAGYTLASGTSCSAASCVAHKLGLVGKNVAVHMAGGQMNVEILNKKVYLSGEVTRIMSGNFVKELQNKLLNK
jgi:diaminopimelate epimerase